MRELSIQEIQSFCHDAVGAINKIYLHWSAGRYGQFFSDYHINIDYDGCVYSDMDSLTEKKAHTYMRNSNAVGIALACAYGASGIDNLGEYPPTSEQIDTLAKVVAVMCVEMGISCDIYHVMTHAEAADNLDGTYPHEPYGPSSTCERWDLLVVEEGATAWSGGDVIREKAKAYAKSWGSEI